MHILMLSDNFVPESNAPANRTHEHCRVWVEDGHKVTVITCAPNFPKGKVFDGYRNKLWQSEEIDGIRVIRVWTFITRNEGFALRIVDYISFMVMGFLAALFVRRANVVIGTSPQFFTACAAWAVGAVKRRPFVFELRDIWPESIRAVGAAKESRMLDMLEKVELFLYRRAAMIVAVTQSFRRTLMTRGIDGTKIEVVTNGVNTARFSPQPKDEDLLRDLGLEGRFVAGYIGTHGMAHALDTIIETAIRLRDRPDAPPISFLMLGDGAERARLVQKAEEHRLDNIIFVDAVPRDQVARYWSVLDIAIIHLKKTPLFETVIPSKIFECMAMAVPILHGVAGESAGIIRENGVGEVFEPENPAAMEAALLRLKDDPETRQRYAANGPECARQYDRTTLARTMLDHLEALVRKTGK